MSEQVNKATRILQPVPHTCGVYVCDKPADVQLRVGGGNLTSVTRLCTHHASELSTSIRDVLYSNAPKHEDEHACMDIGSGRNCATCGDPLRR